MSDPESLASTHPVIGILGGMGPDATLDLMRRVIAATPAKSDEDHIHLIVDNNPKVPSRVAAIIEGTGRDPGPELVRMAKNLKSSGATVLAMPCNTAHAYADRICAAVRIPLLNMVTMTAERIARTRLEHRRVGMLASSAVKLVGLYDRVFAPHAITLVYPERQNELMNVIMGVKRGDKGHIARQAFTQIADDLAADDADVLLVGCTELSILVDSLAQGLHVVDALDVLVEGIVACGLTATKRPVAASRN